MATVPLMIGDVLLVESEEPRTPERPSRRMVSVGIVDDHRAMLVGTTAIIESHPGFHVVAAGRTVAELRALRQPMDVVLLDLTLADGSSATENIALLVDLGVHVLAYAADEPLALLREAAMAGAVGVINKAEEVPHVMATIRAAARGALPAGRDWTTTIERGDTGGARVILSPREAEIFAQYASGDTADLVAREFGISRETVLDHVRRIRRKYARVGRPAGTKIDLFRRAIEDGYVRASE